LRIKEQGTHLTLHEHDDEVHIAYRHKNFSDPVIYRIASCNTIDNTARDLQPVITERKLWHTRQCRTAVGVLWAFEQVN